MNGFCARFLFMARSLSSRKRKKERECLALGREILRRREENITLPQNDSVVKPIRSSLEATLRGVSMEKREGAPKREFEPPKMREVKKELEVGGVVLGSERREEKPADIIPLSAQKAESKSIGEHLGSLGLDQKEITLVEALTEVFSGMRIHAVLSDEEGRMVDVGVLFRGLTLKIDQMLGVMNAFRQEPRAVLRGGGGGGTPQTDSSSDGTLTGAINGVNRTFTLRRQPTAGTERVHLNGLRLNPGSGNDYTLSGRDVIFSSSRTPQSGGGGADVVLVDYHAA